MERKIHGPWTIAGGDAGGAGSEDCLKVNIYAPLGATKGDKCRPQFVNNLTLPAEPQ